MFYCLLIANVLKRKNAYKKDFEKKKRSLKNIDDNNLILDQKFKLSLFGFFFLLVNHDLDFWLYYLFRVELVCLLVFIFAIYLVIYSYSCFFIFLFWGCICHVFLFNTLLRFFLLSSNQIIPEMPTQVLLGGFIWRYSLPFLIETTFLLKGKGSTQRWEVALCGPTLHDLQGRRFCGRTLCLGVIKRKSRSKIQRRCRERINMICSMKCSLRHNAASVLYLFSTGRTHKALQLHNQKHKRRRSTRAKASLFFTW